MAFLSGRLISPLRWGTAGILTGDAKLARHYLELGASFVAVGLDLTLLAMATRGLANEFELGVIAATPVSGASPY